MTHLDTLVALGRKFHDDADIEGQIRSPNYCLQLRKELASFAHKRVHKLKILFGVKYFRIPVQR